MSGCDTPGLHNQLEIGGADLTASCELRLIIRLYLILSRTALSIGPQRPSRSRPSKWGLK